MSSGKLSQSPIQNTVEFFRDEKQVTQLFSDDALLSLMIATKSVTRKRTVICEVTDVAKCVLMPL